MTWVDSAVSIFAFHCILYQYISRSVCQMNSRLVFKWLIAGLLIPVSYAFWCAENDYTLAKILTNALRLISRTHTLLFIRRQQKW